MKRVLMIAFHYPPVQGSSGVQRTLSFSQHLRQFGWEPIVLTAHPRAYPQTGDDQLGRIPADLTVTRAFALDSARHLAIGGSYLQLTALPDRWVSWWFGAVVEGLRLVRRHRPSLIWSTYPIATAHLAALTLQRLTGLPWIADFRDPMTGEGYPPDRTKRACYAWIERHTVRRATKLVFAAPGNARNYAEHYRGLPSDRWCVIENGYDEDSFQAADRLASPRDGAPRQQLRLVHSGLLNPAERDPSAFFTALAQLRSRGTPGLDRLRIVLRATGHDAHFRRQLHEHGLEDLIELAPPLPYVEALAEMLDADGLLLFQAALCNELIPAKFYEYLRAGRPILALTDPQGDTAQALRTAGVGTILRLDSVDELVQGIPRFLADLRARSSADAAPSDVTQYSRAMRTRQLAELFDACLGTDPAPQAPGGPAAAAGRR